MERMRIAAVYSGDAVEASMPSAATAGGLNTFSRVRKGFLTISRTASRMASGKA